MIYKAPSLPYGGDYRGLAEYAEGADTIEARWRQFYQRQYHPA